MKVLYAALAVAVIALSGCENFNQFWADFFKFKTDAEVDTEKRLSDERNMAWLRMQQDHELECFRSQLNTGFVTHCASHGDRDREHEVSISDLRLKRDVVQVGALPNGIPLYEFNYIWGGPRYVGVMAQDVLKVMPQAVIVDEYGFYRVDYSMLGTRMVLAPDQPRAVFASGRVMHRQGNPASP